MRNERLDTLKLRLRSDFAISTISECSLDDAQSVTLVSDTDLPVYNFDSIVQNITTQFGRFLTPSSLDSLFVENGQMTFVEFKNMEWRNIKLSDVQLKIHESITLLKMKYGLKDEDFHGTTVYIVHRPNPDVPATHRHHHSLNIPGKFKFIEASLQIRVIRYMADDFQAQLALKKTLPFR